MVGDTLELKLVLQEALLCVFQLLEAIQSLLVYEFVLANEVALKKLLLLRGEGTYLFFGLGVGRSCFWRI